MPGQLQKYLVASSDECSLSPDDKIVHRFEIPDGNDREFCGAQLTIFDRARPRREAHSHSWYWAIPPSIINIDLRGAFLA